MNRRQQQIFGIGITLVIISIIIIAVLSFYQTRRVNEVSSRVDYTQSVLSRLSEIFSTTIEHADAIRNYATNGDTGSITKLHSTSAILMAKAEELKTNIADNRSWQAQIDSLEKYITKRIDFSNQIVNEGKEKGLSAANTLYLTGTGRSYNNVIHSYIQKMQADELNTLKVDEQKNTSGIRQLAIYLIGLLAFLLILIVILVRKWRIDMHLRRQSEDDLTNFNQLLQKQVKEKTAELTGVFERITDGFIALDKKFCFTYVNKRAGEMTDRDPDSFIGKNMFDEFGTNISPQFRDAMHKAMKEQEYIYFEEFSPAYRVWFEDHLYPSPQGLSIFYRDITERKTAEEALRKSEERYKALIEQASDPIMITDEKGKFIDVNTSFCNKFGYTKEELQGLSVEKVIDPNQLKDDPMQFERLLAGEAVFRERRMISKNGKVIEVEANVKMMPDGRMLAIARDITERKKIAEEKERVRYLLNERVKELTTLYRVGQILQAEDKPVETLLKEIVSILPDAWQYPDIAAARISLGNSEYSTSNFRNGPHKQSANFQVTGGTNCQIEVIYLEERPEEAEGPFSAEERNLINMVAEMLRIYFARKAAAEQTLNEKNLSDSVINSLPGVFYSYDINGKFVRWNERFEQVTGYNSEEISRMHPLDFFEGEDKAIVRKCMTDVFEKGTSEAEALFFTKSKRKIPYYFTGASIMIDGQPYVLGTGIDITERKKAEEELRISREHLKKSYEDIRLLASNIENIREEEKIKIAREIHDELGQQLTGLKMDISWLAKKLNPQEAIFHDKIKQILSLLDETVKSVRRIASELRPGLLDDLGLFAAIEWQSQEFEKRYGIKMQFDSSGSDENIPPRIATGLFRIFQESLTNVARHAQAHNIITTLERNEDHISLQIADDGNGFDAGEIENKKTLGLLGMKERTMMMGGRYEISSQPGKGTTVLVTVTLTKDSGLKSTQQKTQSV